MAKLWQKAYSVDALLEEFTVGRDHILDRELGVADCAGSIAHVRMLAAGGYVSQTDLAAIEGELRGIAGQFHRREIEISRANEDCHTEIEERLVQALNEAGKRVHLGRSRNDQVMTMLRLYGREYLLEIRRALLDAVEVLIDFSRKHEKLPMPGRTHMQIAMPSSVGLWAAAFAEDLMDANQMLERAFELYNRSPLGTAAGYGVPLNIDRERTAGLMGFASVQNNVLSVQNSRGRLEATVASVLEDISLALSKAAQDLILFSLPEFGYFSLPDELCTGSSIMPQKKNPDGLELLRSRCAAVSGWVASMKGALRALPSGYNRDYQDTKEPFLRVLQTVHASLRIFALSFEKLDVHEDALRQAHSPEIYATDEAIALVKGGMTFRDAYRQVGQNLQNLGNYDPDVLLTSRVSTGYAGNLGLDHLASTVTAAARELEKLTDHHKACMKDLLGDLESLIPCGSCDR